jgi:hypothetical protein
MRALKIRIGPATWRELVSCQLQERSVSKLELKGSLLTGSPNRRIEDQRNRFELLGRANIIAKDSQFEEIEELNK